jgi:cytochrome c oxidase subunit II
MPRRLLLTTVGFVSLLVLGACTHGTSALNPLGPAASDIADHWWVMFWLGTAVYIAVALLLGYALIRGRRRARDADRSPINERWFFTVAGLVIPSIIITIVLVDSTRTGQAVINPPGPPVLTIDVIGHQYWWEVRYPEQGIVTANEIHVPAGQPVELRLTSADVIHSFWVPQLAGKRDLNPGKENVTWIQADEPGVYFGQCAEFCGVQHALMAMLLIAMPQDEFDQWVEDRLAATPEPDEEQLIRGAEVFVDAGCGHCHAIGDIVEEPPTGFPGPDLTHFGSRQTLGSGIIENNPENLAIWVTNPHLMKPGVRMPVTDIEPDDLEALVAFLLSLD